MPEKERLLPEWIRELRPHAIWTLVTFIATALGAAVIRWIPQPNVQTIVIGVFLVVNALLIGWLSWLRGPQGDRNFKAQIAEDDAERSKLLQQIEELGKQLGEMGQVHRREIDGLRQEMQPVIVNDATEIWNPQEQEIRKRRESLNAGARDVLAFMVRSGALPPEEVFAYLNQQGLSAPCRGRELCLC